MEGRKVIQDPVHGSISLEGVFLDVLDRHEMQRLRYVKQLGVGNLVFPGANHTRFEHSLGAYHLAGRMADAIGLSKEDSDAVRMAGLMHDICHSAFSHTTSKLMEQYTGKDHMDLARLLIEGKISDHKDSDDDVFGGSPSISEIIETEGISANDVCNLIAYPDSGSYNLDAYIDGNDHFSSRDYVHQIIHGPVDADQIDYLLRDSYYTGMPHGTVDVERLINTMTVHNDRIVLNRGGITAAEGLMVSRSLMYTAVYFHETSKIAENMVCKAAVDSGVDLSKLYLWTDNDLVENIIEAGGRSSKTIRRVMNRDINKKAFAIYSSDMNEEMTSVMMRYASSDGCRRLESEIAQTAGVDVYDVGVDITSRSNLKNSISIGKTDVSIIDDEGKVRSLAKFSPIARSLQARNPYSWALIVSSPKEMRDSVEKASRKVLGSALDDTHRSQLGNL